MKFFEEPSVKVITFAVEDVITVSSTEDEETPPPPPAMVGACI